MIVQERTISRASYVALVAGLAALVVIEAMLLLRHDVFQGSSGSGELRGSGVAATQACRLRAFDGVELSGSNVLVVHVDPRHSVLVHADDNLLDRVTTKVEGGTRSSDGSSPGTRKSSSAGAGAPRSPRRTRSMPRLRAPARSSTTATRRT
jgi:hypothetical protein